VSLSISYSQDSEEYTGYVPVEYPLASSEDEDIFIILTSIKPLSNLTNNVYKAWIIMKPREGKIEKTRNNYIYFDKNNPDNRYKLYQESKILYYMNCNLDKIGRKTVHTYNTDGNVIDTYSIDDYKVYDDVIPGSLGEKIYDFVSNLEIEK
jgi:hypothetical protein